MDADRGWAIYALIDPRTNEVRYIGWSSDPARRHREHINTARRERSHKARWITSLLRFGLRPGLAIVETGRGAGWDEAERRQIAAHRAAGARLTNGTDGGQGTPGHHSPKTPEHRAKLSAALKGRRLSDEHRAAQRAGNIGRPGRPQSTATREKIRRSVTGRPMSAEAIARSIAGRAGMRQSATHRAKLHQAAIDRGAAKAIRRVEDGAVFASIKAAARATGITRPTIRRALRDGKPGAGWHWERADEE